MSARWSLAPVRPVIHHAVRGSRISLHQDRSRPQWVRNGDALSGAARFQQRAGFVDYVKGKTMDGMTYKVNLDSRKIVGVYQSRGSREYQEDRTSVHTIHLPSSELLASLPSASTNSASSSNSHSNQHHSLSHPSARHRPFPTISSSTSTPTPTSTNKSTNPSGISSTASAAGKKNAPAEDERTMWDPEKAGGEEFAGQLSYFGIFDGHGGQTVSSHLHDTLHTLIETTDTSLRNVTDVVDYTRGLGGYFKRFRGGALSGLVDDGHGRRKGGSGEGKRVGGEEETGKEVIEEKDAVGAEVHGAVEGRAGEQRSISLEERLTLAFLQTDKDLLSRDDTLRCGSTASIALLHSLDSPTVPYFYASKLSITIAHCGDTRILMCAKKDGKVEPLTEKHHAESRVEAARLRRLGHNLITDSFGETSLGDKAFKPAGVTAEPEVKQRIIDGNAYCYLVFVTDGVSALMSDQEIVDLAREAHDPYRAAKTIISFAEDLGAEDNCTCIVVPLGGWGKVGGSDGTAERREYRKQKAGQLSTRMARM